MLLRVWRGLKDIQKSRLRLGEAVIRGEVTIAQAKVVMRLISDAEKAGRTHEFSWNL